MKDKFTKSLPDDYEEVFFIANIGNGHDFLRFLLNILAFLAVTALTFLLADKKAMGEEDLFFIYYIFFISGALLSVLFREVLTGVSFSKISKDFPEFFFYKGKFFAGTQNAFYYKDTAVKVLYKPTLYVTLSLFFITVALRFIWNSAFILSGALFGFNLFLTLNDLKKISLIKSYNDENLLYQTKCDGHVLYCKKIEISGVKLFVDHE